MFYWNSFALTIHFQKTIFHHSINMGHLHTSTTNRFFVKWRNVYNFRYFDISKLYNRFFWRSKSTLFWLLETNRSIKFTLSSFYIGSFFIWLIKILLYSIPLDKLNLILYMSDISFRLILLMCLSFVTCQFSLDFLDGASNNFRTIRGKMR